MLRNTGDNNAFASAQNQAWIDDITFSGYAVMYRDADTDNTNNGVIIFTGSVQNPFRVTWDDNNAEIEVRVTGSTGNSANVVVKIGKLGNLNASGGYWATGTYMLVAWSYEPSTNTLTAWARTPDSVAVITANATHTGTVTGLNDTGYTALWAGGAGEAFLGNWCFVAGTGDIDATDFNSMYAALMPNGSLWACHEVYAAAATVAFHIGLVHTTGGGAKIGDALTTTNLEGRVSAGGSQLAAHTLTSVTGTITIVAPDDYAPTGGWTRQLPGTSVNQSLIGLAIPVLKDMGSQVTPTGVKRILITGNSRSIGHNDGDGGDGALSGGVEYQLIQNVLLAGSGWGNNSAGSPRRVWGDPTLEAATTGTVEDVSTNGATYADWSRVGSGSARTGSLVGGQSYYDRGPGNGRYMVSGATYAPAAFSDAATLGLIDPAAALTFRAYYLKFPGAGTLRWQTAKGTAVDNLATLGSTADIDCDTETDTYTFSTATDTYTAATRTLVITTAVLYDVGDLIHNPARNSIAQIESIVNGGATKTIVLKQGFDTVPSDGDTFSIGPYEIATVDAAHAADAVNVWRGMKFTAVSGDVLVISMDAWATDANGYTIIPVGWGGHGYDDQIASAWNFNATRMIAAIDPDAVVQMYVTQDADGSHVDDYRAEIEAGKPGVGVFQFGEGTHCTSATTLANQNNATIRDNVLADAPTETVAAQDFLEFRTIGDYPEQLFNGEREDTAHFSARGANKLAGILLDGLAGLPSDSDGAEVRPVRHVREVRSVR